MENIVLKPEEISIVPSSWLDNLGTVFEHEGSIYRALSEKGTQIFLRFSLDNLRKLEKKGLIHTEKAKVSVPGFPLIIKHNRVECVSYCQEWTLEMLQDAALKVCKLNLELLKMNLALKDSHPWNLTFHFGQPVFLDFGSIDILEEVSFKAWLDEFFVHFYFPLWLGANVSNKLAYRAMKEHPLGFGKNLEQKLGLLKICVLGIDRHNLSKSKFKNILTKLVKNISVLRVTGKKEEWSNYEPALWKHEIISEVSEISDINSCLDMASNKGEFSIAVAQKGIPVTAIDIDEYSINYLRSISNKQNLPITALYLDYLRPTSSFGVGLFYKNSYERLKSDLTISFAIFHHLIFKSKVNFRVLRDIISNYTKKYALIEFIPFDDKYVQEWVLANPSLNFKWYTRENLVSDFSSEFEFIRLWKCPYNSREILFFKKIDNC